MSKTILITLALLFTSLIINTNRAYAQPSSVQSNKHSISGDKITSDGGISPKKSTDRYLDNNQKRRRIKTGKKFGKISIL